MKRLSILLIILSILIASPLHAQVCRGVHAGVIGVSSGASPSIAYIGVDKKMLGSGTSITTDGRANAAGNLLVAVIINRDTAVGFRTVSAVSDTAGNTWTLASGTEGGFNFNQARLEIWYAKNIASSASNAVTATMSNSCNAALGLMVYEFSGASTTAPLDKTAKGSGTTGTALATAATATTTTANELVFVGAFAYGSSSVTAGSGYTGLQTQYLNPSTIAGEYQLVGAAGQYTGTMDANTSSYWGIAIATFK